MRCQEVSRDYRRFTECAEAMIEITNTLSIDESEIQVEFTHSSGPGGQNVNKVATAVQLRFDVRNSHSLPDDVRKRLIVGLLQRRLDRRLHRRSGFSGSCGLA